MKTLGAFILVLSLILILSYTLELDSLILSPPERLEKIWKKDINSVVLQNESYKKILTNISQIDFTTDDPDLKKFLDQLNSPVPIAPSGNLKLNVHISRWFEGNKYGMVIQHNFFDKQSEDKVFEFGRTYFVGYIW